MKKFLWVVFCFALFPVLFLAGCNYSEKNDEFLTQNQVLHEAATNLLVMSYGFQQINQSVESEMDSNAYNEAIENINKLNEQPMMCRFMIALIDQLNVNGYSTQITKKDDTYIFISNGEGVELKLGKSQYVLTKVHNNKREDSTIDFSENLRGFRLVDSNPEAPLTLEYMAFDGGFAVYGSVGDGQTSRILKLYCQEHDGIINYSVITFGGTMSGSIMEQIPDGFARESGALMGSVNRQSVLDQIA